MNILFSIILAGLIQLHLAQSTTTTPLQVGLGKKCSDPSWRNVTLRENSDYSERRANDLLAKWKRNKDSALPVWNESAYQAYWEKGGNRNIGEEMMRNFLYLDKLVFVECKLNKRTYLEMIEEWIEKMCNITWSPAAQDDGSSNKEKMSYYHGKQYYVDLMSGNFNKSSVCFDYFELIKQFVL
jgi:hypothetical protein